MEPYAVLLVEGLDVAPELGAEHMFERNFLDGYDVDLDPALAERRRRFQPDEAGSDDHRVRAFARLFADGAGIRDRPQREDIGRVEAGVGELVGLAAGRDQQPVEREELARRAVHLARGGIDPRHLGRELEFDSVLGVPIVAAQPQPLLGRISGEIILGKVGPVAWGVGIRAEDRYLAVKAEAAQLVGAGEARGASSNDDDLADVGAGGRGGGGPVLDFAADERAVAFDLDQPAIDRVERGRSKHRAGPQVEAGVMERATDRRAPGEAFAEIAAIVGARSADGVELAVEPREEHGVVAGASGDRSFGGNFAERDPLREIGSRCAGRFTHLMPPSAIRWPMVRKGSWGTKRWLPGPDSNRRPFD